VTQETSHLERGLGARGKQRVSEYLDNIREVERRIQKAEKQASANLAVPDTPIGVPESFDEHAKLMFDLQALAYQTDITRISKFMLARDLSERTFPQIGVPEPHHATSHHGNNPVTIAKLARIGLSARPARVRAPRTDSGDIVEAA
jgi:hypothetical protein